MSAIFRAKDASGEWITFDMQNVPKVDSYDFNTLGQYSDLSDSRGQKIFEGDIVQINEPTSSFEGFEQVKLVDGGFYPFAIAGYDDVPVCLHCTVVGNIYDDKELAFKCEDPEQTIISIWNNIS